jgi:hypothetical protein
MLLPIRRPARPEPLPLRERASAAADARTSQVWLNVRTKRSRPAPLPSRTISPRLRGLSAPQNKK